MAATPVSSKVRAQAILVFALVAGCEGERNQGGSRILGQCQEGLSRVCGCNDGRTGAQVCMNDVFSACDCSGAPSDAGALDGFQPLGDVGFFDGGADYDGPVPDLGFPDFGFVDTGVVVDTGFPDFDSGVPDNGFPPFDAGFFDSGVRPDTGVRPDAGFFDSGQPFDSGIPFLPDGGSGDAGPIPCVDDTQCSVPLSICDNNVCVDGCFITQNCPTGTTCGVLTGRCGNGSGGFCLTDDMCSPPFFVCELPLCVEGCITAGCTGGLSCNPLTGHCQ